MTFVLLQSSDSAGPAGSYLQEIRVDPNKCHMVEMRICLAARTLTLVVMILYVRHAGRTTQIVVAGMCMHGPKHTESISSHSLWRIDCPASRCTEKDTDGWQRTAVFGTKCLVVHKMSSVVCCSPCSVIEGLSRPQCRARGRASSKV